MEQTCCFCEKQFEDSAIKHFCSQNCNEMYWKNPLRLNISTECPRCHNSFTRNVFSIEVAPYQALALCDSCGGSSEVICL